jgi:hypothetical protein
MELCSNVLFFFSSYLSFEDEMQISRMPIPADDCANNEMSVDVNPSDTKSDLETTTKVNGDGPQKLNGTALDDVKEANETSETVVKEEVTDVKTEKLKADEAEEKEVTETEAKEIESEKKTESKSTDEPVKNGIFEPSEEDESQNNIKVEAVKNSDNNENITVDHDKPEDSTAKDDEEVKPMEVDETESVTNVITKVEVEEPKAEEDAETLVEEKLNNGDANHSNEVMKNCEENVNPVNGDANNLDTEKSIKSEKVGLKVPEEEDILSEVSVDTLSPKQVFITFYCSCLFFKCYYAFFRMMNQFLLVRGLQQVMMNLVLLVEQVVIMIYLKLKNLSLTKILI